MNPIVLLVLLVIAAIAAPNASTCNADVTSGMTAYWRIDESSGPAARDSVGTHNATLMGAAAFVTDPQRGKVLSFDGSIGTSALAPTNPVVITSGTILGWVKLDPAGVPGGRIVFPGQSTAGGNRLYIHSNDGQFKIGMGNTGAIGSTGITFDANWHQIALAWNGSPAGSGTFQAYYDGQLVQSSSYAGLTTPSGWFSLGSNYDPTSIPAQSSNWIGRVDEVGVWNRPLSSQEVLSVFNAGQIAPPVTPVPPAITSQVVRKYDFESLKPGNIVGQDFWTTPASGNLAISNAVGANVTRVVGEGDGNGMVTRFNNRSSGFQKFTGTETVAVMQYDLTLTSGDTGGGQIFALGSDRNGNLGIDQPNEYGPFFGIKDGYESLNQYQFGFYLQAAGLGHKYGAPLGNLGTIDDWVQLRLVMNFVTGKGSLFFRNLSRGQTEFIAVEGVQDIDLNLAAGPTPSTWDAMILRNDHHGHFDNLIPNLSAVRLEADFNEDGNVDGADLGACRAGYGTQGGASHGAGDANGDGAVNGADFLLWQRQLGTFPAAVATGVTNVPEPGTWRIAMGLACVVGSVRFGRPDRKALKRHTQILPLGVLTSVIVLIGSVSAEAQSLSRGHQILLNRGLQIQAVIDPQAPSAPVPAFSQSRFAQSNFTGMQIYVTDRRWPLSRYLGPAPGIPVTFKLAYGYLNAVEAQYLPNLVALQLNDEQDISVPVELNAAKNLLADWRTMYPNTIGYLNQSGTINGVAELKHYVSYARPDMVMFDTYAFNGDIDGGSPYTLYRDMQKFRLVGLGGYDGTGQQPIPYGFYLQTHLASVFNNHVTSGSETRLNQFSGWAFGFTFASAYTYYNANSSFFVNGPSDATPRQPFFNEIAETNRQSLNLGPALVRLLNTDVGMVMGQHKNGAITITNTIPAGVPSWTSGAGGDSFLSGISAQNLGSINNGLRGDVVVGHFKPLEGPSDQYFMIVNGLTTGTGTAAITSQSIRLSFNFGSSGINSLLRLSRDTGLVETVSLIHDSGSLYHLDLILEGGTGDLFKYNNGAPYVGASATSVPEPSAIVLIATLATPAIWRWRTRLSSAQTKSP